MLPSRQGLGSLLDYLLLHAEVQEVISHPCFRSHPILILVCRGPHPPGTTDAVATNTAIYQVDPRASLGVLEWNPWALGNDTGCCQWWSLLVFPSWLHGVSGPHQLLTPFHLFNFCQSDGSVMSGWVEMCVLIIADGLENIFICLVVP